MTGHGLRRGYLGRLGIGRAKRPGRSVGPIAAVLVAVVQTAGSASAGDFPTHVFAPEQNGAIEFSTPSNNIGCFYSMVEKQPELTCDRSQPTYLRFVLASKGRATLIRNPGEQPCCSGDPLAYGESWREGPFECDSLASGLRCTSASGHGFSISRAQVEVH